MHGASLGEQCRRLQPCWGETAEKLARLWSNLCQPGFSLQTTNHTQYAPPRPKASSILVRPSQRSFWQTPLFAIASPYTDRLIPSELPLSLWPARSSPPSAAFATSRPRNTLVRAARYKHAHWRALSGIRFGLRATGSATPRCSSLSPSSQPQPESTTTTTSCTASSTALSDPRRRL